MFPRISGGKIWLPYTVKTKEGARGCGTYELRPDDPAYPKIKEWLEAVERCEWSFFPFRPGDELDQAEVDLFMRILPGLAMSTSQNRESRERGLQTIKESLSKLDGMALDMGRRIAFIKAYGGLLGYESQSPEKGWDKVLDILDAEHKRLQAEWQASCKRFYEKKEQKRIERAKKAKLVPNPSQGRKARGQKTSPPVSSSRSKVHQSFEEARPRS
jgi:hypothetical protein